MPPDLVIPALGSETMITSSSELSRRMVLRPLRWQRGGTARERVWRCAEGGRVVAVPTKRSAAASGAVRGRRLGWQGASIAELRAESSTAKTLKLSVPGWPGHLSGQHLDVRLTAPDGYTATRPYSIASAAGEPPELTVGQVLGGEVSTFLLTEARRGTTLEVRG